MIMTLISCTQDCLYQRDGYCALERAITNIKTVPNDFCVNFTPKQQPVRSERPEPPGYS